MEREEVGEGREVEREGEVVGRRGRRGGGEKMRKGIIVGGMVIGLLLGCNNGIADELAVEKRLGEIGRSTENVFYSFMGLIADTLGFRVTKDITKQQVGDHFNSLGTKLGETSAKLEEVAKKAASDVSDKEGLLSKAIREAVDTAKTTLDILKKHLESLKDIGGEQKVGEVVSATTRGEAANKTELEAAYKALKGIVDEAVNAGVAKPKAGSIAVKINSANNKDGANVLATDQGPGAAVGEKAAAILASVSGEEMLESIVASGESDSAGKGVDSAANASTSALKFALGGDKANVSGGSGDAKAAAVAGGIALRSLVKGGKLTGHSTDDDKIAQLVGVRAVNKLVGAVEDMIKKTVKNVIGKARVEINKVRDSKVTVQQQ